MSNSTILLTRLASLKIFKKKSKLGSEVEKLWTGIKHSSKDVR